MATERAGQSVQPPEAGSPGGVARVAAIAAVVAAVLLVGWLLFGQGGGYRVSANFLSASQLVEGNEVRLGGVAVGSVTGLELASNGLARVEMELDDDVAPLDRGTKAIIRQTSLSGIANRYVDLQLPNGGTGGEIADGGTIETEDTTAAVELDSLFNTFDAETRASLRRFIKGSAAMFEGRGDEARAGYRYLAPALSSSERLFGELTADTALLDRFVVDSAGLVTALAERSGDLTGLVRNLDATTEAASRDKAALAGVLERFPDFMRRANTTFVNLRATLDDVDPLVDASKPAARELRRFLPQLRRLARDGEPTVRLLSRTIRDPGRADDLVDLVRTFPALADIAVETKERNGAERPGAFPASEEALEKATPLIAFGRPYTPDLFGWFDDFSHSGSYDALGGFSRTQVYFNMFSADLPPVNGAPQLVPLQDRAADFLNTARTEQYKRCPGHAEVAASDGSNVYTEEQAREFDCDPSDRAAGDIEE